MLAKQLYLHFIMEVDYSHLDFGIAHWHTVLLIGTERSIYFSF